MLEILKAIKEVGATSSRNDKEYLLKKHADIPGFKEILKFVFNPYIRTGIGKAKFDKATANPDAEISWAQMIDHFSHHQTGTDADANYAKSFVYQFVGCNVNTSLAFAIVTKDLKIGVTAKTLNKVYGKAFIPMIGVMKGEKYQEFKEKVKGPFITSEKLDGARRLIVKENSNISIYSNSGIPDEGLVDIERDARHLPDNTVFDGELLAIGEFKDSIALRQATNSIANSKGIRHGVKFHVFDMIPVEDFKAGKSKHTAKVRKVAIASLFGHQESLDNMLLTVMPKMTPLQLEYIVPVPVLGLATTEESVLSYAQPIWDRGFEGVMLNTLDGLYEIKRTRAILKVKLTKTLVLQVIDVEEGTGKNIDKLGALIVDYKGERVGVGSGLTDSERHYYWTHPPIGKHIEVECFGESTNQAGGVSLNCPIFKRVIGAD